MDANGSETRGTQGAEGSADGRAVELHRHFTREGEEVFDRVEWEIRTARIQTEEGDVVFEQEDVEVPASWSTLATNIVASKYFRGHQETRYRETSVKQLIGRVVETLERWGRGGGYFADDAQARIFGD